MIIKLILIILSFLCGRTDTDLVDLLRPTHILSQLGVLISGHPCEIKVTNVLNKNCENLTKQDIEWVSFTLFSLLILYVDGSWFYELFLRTSRKSSSALSRRSEFRGMY